MTSKTVFQLRVDVDELARWRECAPINLSAWVRGVMEEECDRMEALSREMSGSKRERVEQITAAFPQSVVTAAQIGGAYAEGKRSYEPDPK